MCIKALKHCRNDIFNGQPFKDSKKLSSLKRASLELLKSRKDLERELCEFFERKTEGHKRSAWYADYEERAKSLDNKLYGVTKQIDAFRKEAQENRANEQESIDLRIRWLMVELDSGGNIRMESGSIERTWYRNCVELVTSQFSVPDFAPFGIIGVCTKKVTRIHNRFLQDRFEQQMETKTRRRHVEYLLYGETSEGHEELQFIIEEGFPYAQDQMLSASFGPVLLSNSIGLADIYRLQGLSDQLGHRNASNLRAKGWILVVKAYLGVSVEDDNVGTEFVIVTQSSYPNVDSVYRIHPSDPAQRSWFIFDSSLLVPEYLVEFEYVFSKESASRSCSPQPNKHSALAQGKADGSLSLVRRGIQSYAAKNPSPDTVATLISIKSFDKLSFVDLHEAICICSTSALRQTPISNYCKVTHLNLHNSNIAVLESLKGLINLKVLILSFNKISQINKRLEGLEKLEILDLSHNLLKQIDGLSCLPSLITLDISGNHITTLYDLHQVLLQVPKLMHLNMRGNSVEELKSYRETILKSLVSLVELDCVPVDAASAPLFFMTSSDETKMQMGPISTEKYTVNSSTTMHKFSHMELIRPRNCQNTFLAPQQQFEMQYDDDIEELHLENQHLTSMLSFDNLSCLRRLFLTGNEIATLEGLEKCTLLEELILEDNCISEVGQSILLPALWKLELGRNSLNTCTQLSGFHNLTQLSIERNKIDSLKGLSCLTSLMELYAAHNRLCDVIEISNLRTLPKLMVLDLSGNQLCEALDYRSYTIFTLKKLKVFDGMVVDDTEVAEARERHMGRLTRDMLEEFSGIKVFDNVDTLNLSGKSLRHCGNVFESTDLFRLKELDLSGNYLTSIEPLKSLHLLQRLLLRSNNIGDGPLLEIDNDIEGSLTRSIDSPNTQIDVDGMELTRNMGVSCLTLIPFMPNLDQQRCFHKLKILELDHNSISDIRSLNIQQGSPNLRVLSLKSNAIAKVYGLNGLTSLEKLYLDHNCINKIEPCSFENLPSLEELHLSNNTIRAAKHLENLSLLRTLNLSANYLVADRLGGLPCIKDLASLTQLQNLALSENPICRQPQYRCAVISVLRQLLYLDGEGITEDEILDSEAYVNREEKACELLALESDILSPLDTPGLNMTANHILNGKVALKVTPFKFDAMSPLSAPHGHLPSTTASAYQVPLHRSLDSLDSENIRGYGGVQRLSTPFLKSKLEGERRVAIPLVLMKNFSRVKERSF